MSDATVLIKSFNRPWSLDRCLHSLSNVDGVSRIVVVDDGTEQKYLDILKHKHPEIILITDPRNKGKVESIRKKEMGPTDLWNGIDPNKTWVGQVKKYADDYFFLHEDDVYTPRKWNLSSVVDEMRQKRVAYLDLSGKFGSSVRVDKILEKCENFDIVANTRAWSWFAAAFCVYYVPLFDYLYGPGLKGKLQAGDILVQRAKEFYSKNPKMRGASTSSEAKLIIGDNIPARRGYKGPPHIQKMNDILNESWANGSFSWEEYYPDLEPFEELLKMFKKAGIDDRSLNEYVAWRNRRLKEYRMPYNHLDGKIRWDDT